MYTKKQKKQVSIFNCFFVFVFILTFFIFFNCFFVFVFLLTFFVFFVWLILLTKILFKLLKIIIKYIYSTSYIYYKR